MATLCESVCLGTQCGVRRRVVRDQKSETTLGIQTGIIRHGHDDIPVWRPANPRALGLNHSWRDGHWQNIYHIALEMEKVGDKLYAREPVSSSGVIALLPAARLVRTKALDRYLGQRR